MAKFIDWARPLDKSLFLENPHWDSLSRNFFKELVSQAPPLKDHIWISTSGSSADAETPLKLVGLERNAFLSSANAVNTHLSVTTSDRWLKPLPSFHVGGLSILTRAALGQNSVIELNEWNVEKFVQLIHTENITLTSLVPTQIYDLVSCNAVAPNSIRAVLVGGAALDPQLYQKARALGWPLLPSFGMTETCSQVATAALSSLEGPTHEFPELKILSHVECRTDAHGILSVRGSSLFSGYVRHHKNEIMFIDPKRDGWFETSDRVSLVGNILGPKGRSDEVIKIRGEQVDLYRLRQLWSQHLKLNSSIANGSALIDVSDARLGSKLIVVFEVPGVQHTTFENDKAAEAIIEFNAQRSGVERIGGWILVDRIPRTELNKIQWQKLRNIVDSLKVHSLETK